MLICCYCRHYVNNLVSYTTGVEHSTQLLKRYHFRSKCGGRWVWHGWFVEASQFATDVGNWSHIQAGVCVAVSGLIGMVTGVWAIVLLCHNTKIALIAD